MSRQGIIELKLYLEVDVDSELKEEIIESVLEAHQLISHIEEN